MAELLKQQHKLVTLRLALDRSCISPSSRGCAVFTLQIPDKPSFEIKVDCAEIGLPKNLREVRSKYTYSEPSYSIPDTVVQELKKQLSRSLDPGVPLWLQLATDCGLLAMVPWERLLQPRLGVTLLRLPYFALKPFSPLSSSLDIVLCASTPVAKVAIPVETLLDRLTHLLLDTMQREVVTIHVFADALVYPHLTTVLQDRIASTNGKSVKLYDPARAPLSPSPASSSSIQETPGLLESPWLLWIIDAFKNRSADVVHFICHGYLSTDQGALMFAESPTLNMDHTWARFVGTQQLSTFLTHLGASTAGFSSPESNYSKAGLWLLADQLAHLQAGSVLLHEVKDNENFVPVAQVYSFLFDDTQDSVPSSPDLALYCHPGRVKQIAPQPADAATENLLNQYTLAKGETLKLLEAKENTPAWIASSQRYLEQSVAQLINIESPSLSPTPDPTQQGMQEALGFLSDVLTRHASSTSASQEKEGSQ